MQCEFVATSHMDRDEDRLWSTNWATPGHTRCRCEHWYDGQLGSSRGGWQRPCYRAACSSRTSHEEHGCILWVPVPSGTTAKSGDKKRKPKRVHDFVDVLRCFHWQLSLDSSLGFGGAGMVPCGLFQIHISQLKAFDSTRNHEPEIVADVPHVMRFEHVCCFSPFIGYVLEVKSLPRKHLDPWDAYTYTCMYIYIYIYIFACLHI